MPMARKIVLSLLVAAASCCQSSMGQGTPAEAQRPSLARAAKTDLSVFHLEGKGGALLYLGTVHTGDPRNPQLDDIADLWSRFEPTLVLNEGRDPGLKFASREEAVRAFGEMGWARYLSAERKVPARSFDPPFAAEVDEIAGRFAATDAKCFYLARMVPVIARKGDGAGLEAGMQRFLDGLPASIGPQVPPAKLDDIDAQCGRLTGSKPWRTASEDLTSPAKATGTMGDIAKASSALRDKHMARALVDAVREGHRVLAIAGAAHLQAQRQKVVRALMTGAPVAD